jgi:proline utilization trans-activator
MKEKCRPAFSFTADRELSQTARNILSDMARLGNNASKDHERMIQEIENLFPTGSAYTGPTDGIEDLIGWSDYMEFGGIGFDSIEPSTFLQEWS